VALRLRLMRWGAVLLMALYHAHLWLNRALFARAQNAPANTEFDLALMALAVGGVAILAGLTNSSDK
jgi:hypothetical protein